MGWQSNYDQLFGPGAPQNPYWGNSSGMTRFNYDPGDEESLWYNESPARTFNPNKRYIFITSVDNFSNRRTTITYDKYLILETPWGSIFTYEKKPDYFDDTSPATPTPVDLFYISSPNSEITSNDIVEYRSNYAGFGDPTSDPHGTPVIEQFRLVETDWYFQGWAHSSYSQSEGWWYNDATGVFMHRIWRMGYPIQLNGVSSNATPITAGSGYPTNGAGSNYVIDGGLGTASISTGSGWGLSVTYSVSGGSVTSVSLISIGGSATRGAYYLENDIISIPGGTVQATIDITGVTEDDSFPSSKSIGGHTASNYIARYIDYPTFNVSFRVDTNTDTDSYARVYLADTLPPSSNNPVTFENFLSSSAQFLGNIHDTSNAKYTFYDLTGEQFLIIVSNYFLPTASTGATIEISEISIEGAYQEDDNNEQFLFTNSGTYSEPTDLCIIGGSPNATYSVVVVNENTLHEIQGTPSNTFAGATGNPGFFSNLYGDVINLNFLNSKVGNGTFKAGVWENGVWNSGWRVDTNVHEFDDVEIALLMQTTNTKWRIQLTGPLESVSQFKVGDRVSIGNIVGIDINENRKLMKNYFTVLSVNTTNIVVDFNNTFPLRRIEKDSENHKILVSKNVWLNGGFLNGYFEGIWNNGLFKGFPFITEMYNTHWIDGRYDGGHFYGEYPESRFIDTYWYNATAPNTLGLTYGATAHGLKVGDIVTIDKDNKLLNPQYDGDATVIAVVDDYMIVVDKQFGASSTLEGGLVKRRTGTGVIQNFEFYDNNVASKTLNDYQPANPGTNIPLKTIYNYNSWIDVKYLDESASNIGRDLISFDPNIGEYSDNNLYGYITKDVLASVASFRNSYSLNKTVYSLGTKYKIYEDFIGDASEFNEPFDSTDPNLGLDNFLNNGWTFSGDNSSIERISNETMQIISPDTPSQYTTIFDNTNITIDKKRYSVIEFDLIDFDFETNDNYGFFYPETPLIYLNNYLFVKNTANLFNPPKAAFPNSNYVYHNRTEDTKKYEYFYNRRGLDLSFRMSAFSSGYVTASIDNLKFYELDMIPFFQYATVDYINRSVQVPYQGIAPFIDYEDNQFSFIDNINIGLDSLSTQQSFNPPTGGGDDGPIFEDPAFIFTGF